MSKKKNQRFHARVRARLRYDITFGREARSALVKSIQSGKAIFLSASSNRAKSFAVNYEGSWYPVVYDNLRKEIVTFLPPNYLERYRYKLNGANELSRNYPSETR